MKAIIVVGAKHFDEDIRKIFEQAEINVYSQTDVSGHKEQEGEQLSGNWFALSNDDQKSIVFFSFTEENKANELLRLVREYNSTIKSKSRIRAFIMAVENHD